MKEIRKKTTYFLLFSVLLFNLSCNKDETSVALKKHFSNEQINDLKLIHSFFITEHLNGLKKKFKEEFYLLTKTNEYHGLDSLFNKARFNEQLELYNSISQTTFDEVWIMVPQKKYEDEKYIALNMKGKFIYYLKGLTKNDFAKTISNKLELAGDLNYFYIYSYVFNNYKSFDFENYDNQLIISVCYLTMLDGNFRKDTQRDDSIRRELRNQTKS